MKHLDGGPGSPEDPGPPTDWPATEVLPDPLKHRVELEELRFAVERIRLRDKADLPATLGIAPTTRSDAAASVSRALATVLAADADLTVCFAQLDRSSQDEEAGVGLGAVDVVRGSVGLEDALVPTANPRLQYLPVGGATEQTAAPLRRGRDLQLLFERLRMSFSHVVVQLPPLLDASEALAIVGHCDGCLVVAEHGVTTRSELREALDSLGEVRRIGVVLTGVRSRVPGVLRRLLAD